MKNRVLVAIVALGMTFGHAASGAATPGGVPRLLLAAAPVTNTATSWSVDKVVLGEAVYSDAGERIGTVGAIIITPRRTVSHLIVGVGDYVGTGRHDVAIPVTEVFERHDGFVLRGATKAVLRAMPVFEYAPAAQSKVLQSAP